MEKLLLKVLRLPAEPAIARTAQGRILYRQRLRRHLPESRDRQPADFTVGAALRRDS
jgi:hypothetical protein